MDVNKEHRLRAALNRASDELVAIEIMLHDVSLHATAKLVNEAVQKLSWEAAQLFSK